MTTPADALQVVLKTLSDTTRVRILWLLEREELVVQELMEVLGMAQSRVSRHLSILRKAGLLQDRRDGTYVSYRFIPPDSSPWSDAWKWVSKNLESDPMVERDAAILSRVIAARGERARSFFDSLGPEWDAVRRVFNDDALRARAVSRLVSPRLRVADIGTGTGVLAIELAELGLDVIALDSSSRMLEATRSKLEERGLHSIELRQGLAHDLPFADSEVDAAFAHMVLQYLPKPDEAIAEMARIVKPGGLVVIADFVEHSLEWMRDDLGVTSLGFSQGDMEAWLAAAGLESRRIDVFPSFGRDQKLPGTFIATGQKAPGTAEA